MDFADAKRVIDVALGAAPADLVVRNCRLVDVNGESILECDLLIAAGKVAALVEPGAGEASVVVQADRRFAVPGLIDSHMHIESTLLSLGELARLVVPRGVTTIMADPHEVANVLGIRGIRLLLDTASELPLRVLIQVPSRVPTAPEVETTGGVIGLAEIEEMLGWSETIALGELDPSKVLPPRSEYLARVQLAQRLGKITCGHAADLGGRELMAYASIGLADDHECVTPEEIVERVRAGMRVNLREGTSERDLETLVRSVTELGVPTRRLMHCTDDKQVLDLMSEGHIDHNVRKAIACGISPIQSIQMATVNPAEHFHIEQMVGSLAPGRSADLFLCSDLDSLRAEAVVFEGKIVARDGELLQPPGTQHYPEWAVKTVHLRGALEGRDFKIAGPADRAKVTARVIKVIEGLAIDEMILVSIPVVEGEVRAQPEKDLLKIAVVERHRGSGRVGLGLVSGFGFRQGAMASTVCHDNHNLIVVGSDDQEMAVCANAVAGMGGGFALVRGGEVVSQLPLTVAGIMSDRPYEEVGQSLADLNQAARQMGIRLSDPFMKLSILALPTVPEIGLTDMGLIDVATRSVVPLFAEG